MLWFIPALIAAFSDSTKDYISKRAMKKINHYLAAWSQMALTLPFLLTVLIFAGIPKLGPIFLEVLIANSIVYVISVALYMKAISKSPLSLTLPMIAFTPAFMLITGPLILGEFPKTVGLIGILSIVVGAYILKIKDIKKDILSPFISLAKEKGPLLMFIVAILWSFTSVTGKLLIEQSSPVFAMVSIYSSSTIIFTVFTFITKKIKIKDISKNFKKIIGIGFFTSLSDLSLSFAFTMTFAVYAIAVKRLSILIGSFYGFKFFKERDVVQRVSGSILMLAGIILIAL